MDSGGSTRLCDLEAFTAVNATTAVAVSNRYNFLTGTDG